MNDCINCGATAEDNSFRFTHYYPCSRRGTVERDAKWYCWQHDPEYIERKKKEREDKWKRKWAREKESWRRKDAERNACKGVPTEILENINVKSLLEQINNE